MFTKKKLYIKVIGRQVLLDDFPFYVQFINSFYVRLPFVIQRPFYKTIPTFLNHL